MIKLFLIITLLFSVIRAANAQPGADRSPPQILGQNSLPTNPPVEFARNRRAICAVIDEDIAKERRNQLQVLQHHVDVTYSKNENQTKNICPSLRTATSTRLTNFISSGACVLIGDRYILTVAHNLKYQQAILGPAEPAECKRQFVFDYRLTEDPRPNQIYQCRRIVYQNRTADVAVIELDRPVSDRLPANVRLTSPDRGRVASPTSVSVYALGFPFYSGELTLSTGDAKWASPHFAFPDDSPSRFETLHFTNHAVPGFSGGGLFNGQDGMLEGIVKLSTEQLLEYDRGQRCWRLGSGGPAADLNLAVLASSPAIRNIIADLTSKSATASPATPDVPSVIRSAE